MVYDHLLNKMPLHYLQYVLRQKGLRYENFVSRNIFYLLKADFEGKDEFVEFVSKYFDQKEINNFHNLISEMHHKNNSSKGYLEHWFDYYIQKAGYKTSVEFDTGFRNVDLYVEDLKLLIEIDGLTHFNIKEGVKKMNRMTKFRNYSIGLTEKYKNCNLVTIETSFQQDSVQSLQ
jgi:hypothetical protein